MTVMIPMEKATLLGEGDLVGLAVVFCNQAWELSYIYYKQAQMYRLRPVCEYTQTHVSLAADCVLPCLDSLKHRFMCMRNVVSPHSEMRVSSWIHRAQPAGPVCVLEMGWAGSRNPRVPQRRSQTSLPSLGWGNARSLGFISLKRPQLADYRGPQWS